MDYEKCRERLLEIAEIMDGPTLDAKLSGRLKYHPVTREALPFEGISVICNIPSRKAHALGLPTTLARLQAKLEQAELGTKIAFVSRESFHATTFDLINEGEHGATLRENGYDYQEVRNQVQQATLQFLDTMNLQLTAQVRITGVGMFCPGVLKLDLEFSEVIAEVFQAYRLALHRYLGEQVTAYAHVRATDWNRKLAGHITLGYLVAPLTVQEIDRFLDILREFNAGFSPLNFELTQGEVTAFTDMDHYAVVEPPERKIAQFVRESIASVPPFEEFQLDVEEAGIFSYVVDGKTWWRVPVIPTPWPRQTFALYEALAEVEGHLQDERDLDILLFVGDPISEEREKVA